MHKPAHPPRQTPWQARPPLAHLGQPSPLGTLPPLIPLPTPHTEWRIPSGQPAFAPPSLASRLIGRMRRLRARWRRFSAARGVQTLHI